MGLFDFLGGGVDYTGQNTGTPALPAFQNIYQSYMPDEEKRLDNLPKLNGQPLKNLEDFSTSGSDNPWVKAQMAAEEQAKGQAMGSAKANASAGTTSAMDTMAAHGGLNSGALERLATNGQNNATMAGQDVIGKDLAQKGQIQTQNAQNELGVAENLPGQEVQALQPALQEQSLWQQAAAGNQAAQEYGLNAQNQYNMTAYQNQIAKQAGDEEATAMANRGKK